jgi:hypothetical protein
MQQVRRKKRDKLGTRSNEHFEKTSILRRRERRGLSFGGGGWRRDAAVWPEKLVAEFAGTQAVYDELRREMEVFGSGISALRRTPVYI